tara:strand:- start:89 stop:508 length:420 start_codon:yes stop_codon:yes gene_type:complete
MNVLMIKDLANQPPSLNHNSEMDKDWTKFGYRRAEWQEDDIDWSKAINPYYKGLYDYVRDTKYYLNWENDDLSLHDVMRWCAEEFSQAKLRNIVDPFMYDKFFMDPSVEWKDFIEQENMQPRREHILNHIDGYISKKLL